MSHDDSSTYPSSEGGTTNLHALYNILKWDEKALSTPPNIWVSCMSALMRRALTGQLSMSKLGLSSGEAWNSQRSVSLTGPLIFRMKDGLSTR